MSGGVGAWDLLFRGRVQGVGFRPTACAAARELGVRGWVRNTAGGVVLHAEASVGEVDDLVELLSRRLPPAARIESMDRTRAEREPCGDFAIRESDRSGDRGDEFVPDASLCDDCRAELLDPSNRRHLHPFLSCACCGPRYSIGTALPFDRERTSMAGFPLCERCRAEYGDPSDRRFHAQTICCPDCGPRMRCERPDPRHAGIWHAVGSDWREAWIGHLRSGGLAVVKGIGGFHLMADAFDPLAVRRLRQAKGRDRKPFAVLFPDMGLVRTVCRLDPREEELLLSPARPIVPLEALRDFPSLRELSPGLATVGAMLPSAPLHEVLFAGFRHPVVATSANLEGEPMVVDDDRARTLAFRWNALLVTHDRAIVRRVDDDVAVPAPDGPGAVRIRPGRGSVPTRRNVPGLPDGVAFGGDLRNAPAVAIAGSAILASPVGDLDHPAAQEALEEAVDDFVRRHAPAPAFVACDAHPDYHSSRLARQFAAAVGAPLVAVQHHHAHLAATWLDHRWDGPAVGLAFDGTGYGDPDCLWGSEAMLHHGASCRSRGHLEPIRLPGGERAIRDPRRLVLSVLHDHVSAPLRDAWLSTHPSLVALEEEGIGRMLRSDLHCPRTRGMGRLFDLVGAMVGWEAPSWDGEHGTRFEGLDRMDPVDPWPVEMEGDRVLLRPLVEGVLSDLLAGEATESVAMRLHATVAAIGARLALHAETAAGEVLPWALAGGVFHNRAVVRRLRALPQTRGRTLHLASVPGDFGLAPGQLVAAWHLLGKD